jgi:predicted metal-dependent HD superfamily phosphohydrolase
MDRFDELAAAYGSPDRHYHTMAHMLDCLDKLDLPEVTVENKPCVQTAIWFHDAVYDTHASENERRSADLAYQWSREIGVAADFCQEIYDLVIATDHRTEPATHDARVICDIDLSIFGESRDKFRLYDRRIALEYAWVPPDVYREKRSAVVQAFLRRPRIFRTDWFYEIFEASARNNLTTLLTELRT